MVYFNELTLVPCDVIDIIKTLISQKVFRVKSLHKKCSVSYAPSNDTTFYRI